VVDPRKRAKILEKVQSGRATRAERLWLKQEGLCFYCWTDLGKDITKEHLDSRANGGTSDKANLRVAHSPCNGIVGSLPVEVKLELHELGRDKGADAFWNKAREYQQKFGPEHRAYARKGSGRPWTKQALTNANAHPALEEPHQLNSGEAEQELKKLQLGGSRVLSKAEKLQLIQDAEVFRKGPEFGGQLTWAEWWRILERMGTAGLARARQKRAA
jgi:hypothetical protein